MVASSKARVVQRVVKAGSGASRSRRKSASTAAHTEAQNAIYVAPWVLLILLGVLGQVLWLLWGDRSWQWMTHIGMVMSVAGVAYAGWLNTRARTSLALGHTLTTILMTGAWLILCSETGMFALEYVDWAWWRMPVPQHPTFDLFFLVGLPLTVVWNIRQGIHAKEAKDAELAGETMDEWGEAGVPGVRGHLKVKNQYFKEGMLLLPRGETLQHLQAASKAIESAFDWPLNSLTLLPASRGLSARRVKARVMMKDPLAEAVNWTGVDTNPKLTLFDPIKSGMRADGVVSTVYVAKPEGTKHALVQGMSGSGKTEGQKPVILECAYRGAVQIIIDIVSGVQMFGSMAPALQWLITDEGTAKAVIKRLAEVVIPARMEQLARERRRTWDPKSSLKLLRIHIEEAWSLLDADELMAIAVSARKAGVQLTVSLQRASHDQLNTTVREQLGTRLCYGLGGQFGTMILDDEVLDAGANPVQWKDEVPGMHYLIRGGLSIAEKATPTRSFYDDGPVKFGLMAAQIAGRISEMDEVTAQAFGVLWGQRILPVEVVRRAESFGEVAVAAPQPVQVPQVQSSVTRSSNGHPANSRVSTSRISDLIVEPYMDDDRDVPGQLSEEDLDQAVLEVCMSEDGMQRTVSGDGLPTGTVVYNHEDPDPDIVGDFNDEFLDGPGDDPPLRFDRQGGAKVSRMELDARMRGRLEELRNKGASVVRSAELVMIPIEGGYTRTMVYKYLDAWVSDGVLHQLDDGTGWIFVKR